MITDDLYVRIIMNFMIYLGVIRMFRKSGAFGGLPGAGGGSGGRPGGFGGMSSLFDVTRANYKVINKGEKVKTKFRDVAGLDNAKEEVSEFVHFLRDPHAYTKLGARIPKGLFYHLYTLILCQSCHDSVSLSHKKLRLIIMTCPCLFRCIIIGSTRLW